MMILALDAALSGCSVAVRDDARLLAHDFAVGRRDRAADVLMPMVRDVMAAAGVEYSALDAVAVTQGPGSYTGVRVGLAAARGLALAAGCAALGVTTLEVVARAARDALGADAGAPPILVCLQTQRADIYLQLFDAELAPVSEAAAGPIEVVRTLAPHGKLILAGDAAEQAGRLLDGDEARRIRIAPGVGQPDATVVAAIAAERLATASPPSDTPQPLYLRPPSVTVTAANRR